MANNVPKAIDDQYQIRGVLGEGPYASVYEAIDTEGERVAVKVFDPRMRRDAIFTAYFRRNVQALQTLRHPQLVPIRAYGISRGSYYVVMPVVDGDDLSNPAESIVPASVARTGAETALVLDLLHRHGHVHGAIKPTNLFLTEADGIQVTPSGGRNTVIDTVLPGAQRKVVSYMSPEQIAGRPVTAATDIYSLGVVLYEECTEILPFRGQDAAEIATRHMQGTPVAPRALGAAVPSELEHIILRCLSLDPADRYGSARELAEDLSATTSVSQPMAEEREMTEIRTQR